MKKVMVKWMAVAVVAAVCVIPGVASAKPEAKPEMAKIEQQNPIQLDGKLFAAKPEAKPEV